MAFDLTEEQLSLFLTAEKFYATVDNIVWRDDVSHLSACIMACDEYGIDPEDLVPLQLITPKLEEFIREESMKEGMLRKESFLPFAL